MREVRALVAWVLFVNMCPKLTRLHCFLRPYPMLRYWQKGGFICHFYRIRMKEFDDEDT